MTTPAQPAQPAEQVPADAVQREFDRIAWSMADWEGLRKLMPGTFYAERLEYMEGLLVSLLAEEADVLPLLLERAAELRQVRAAYPDGLEGLPGR